MTKQWHTLFHGWKDLELLLPKEELTPLTAVTTIVQNFEIGIKRLLEVPSRLLSGKKIRSAFLLKWLAQRLCIDKDVENPYWTVFTLAPISLFFKTILLFLDWKKKLYINSSICYLFRMQNVSCKSTLEEFALDTEKFPFTWKSMLAFTYSGIQSPRYKIRRHVFILHLYKSHNFSFGWDFF